MGHGPSGHLQSESDLAALADFLQPFAAGELNCKTIDQFSIWCLLLLFLLLLLLLQTG